MNNLDDMDWTLIALLQEDARRGYRDLARHLGVAPATVASRIKRLERRNVIAGYHARINPDECGYPISAFIVVNTAGRRQSLRVDEIARAHRRILEDHRVTGTDDHVLRVIATEIAELEPLIDELNDTGKPSTTLILSSPKPWAPVPPPHNPNAKPPTHEG